MSDTVLTCSFQWVEGIKECQHILKILTYPYSSSPWNMKWCFLVYSRNKGPKEYGVHKTRGIERNSNCSRSCWVKKPTCVITSRTSWTNSTNPLNIISFSVNYKKMLHHLTLYPRAYVKMHFFRKFQHFYLAKLLFLFSGKVLCRKRDWWILHHC